ncbi:MAG TPA: vitamin B12-dependent ribonucleotide reductase, partial [Thermogutta sp.]|nr:vitamin B12-dependent ribonucleotide reductase [Thermogutta sp.]
KASPKKSSEPLPAPRRERLPDTRRSITHKFSINGHEGYITVGLYPDGRPGELFITMSKEGSTIGGLMDCFGTAVSMSLQYGVPLEVYVNKFSYTRFDPMGFTKNPEIRTATSIVDYIFRWLGMMFLPGYREKERNMRKQLEKVAHSEVTQPQTGKPPVSGTEQGVSSEDGKGVQGNPAASDPWLVVGGPLPASLKGIAQSLSISGNGQHQVATDQTRGEESLDMASEVFPVIRDDGPPCDVCGAITRRCGSCFVCLNCGRSLGCS